ncbi:MAG: hypothetical protein HC853_11750 [Anaerolineae bacterium]|nr:hypothetical protein [Anaerolineae bacterium]
MLKSLRAITLIVLLIGLAACTRTGESGNVAAIPTADSSQPSAVSDQPSIPDPHVTHHQYHQPARTRHAPPSAHSTSSTSRWTTTMA